MSTLSFAPKDFFECTDNSKCSNGSINCIKEVMSLHPVPTQRGYLPYFHPSVINSSFSSPSFLNASCSLLCALSKMTFHWNSNCDLKRSVSVECNSECHHEVDLFFGQQKLSPSSIFSWILSWCGVVVRVSAQVSSSSFDQGSKLRAPSPITLVLF
ncbi:hypothetical protein TNCV_2047211 [Trichonephila clavipes]|uniref:Uncharacterized protein n=1 Tax=Trichonephila clavipes TaxID=2585209 RepID=A0A8X6SVT3_TRICX|nr:hypothetical protein TNCV_2047211 [Trichonephila clavipes]